MKQPAEKTFSMRMTGIARSYTAPFLTALVIISLAFFVLVPEWINLETAKRNMSERVRIRSALERKVTQLSAVDVDELEAEVRDATSAVPMVIPYQQVLNEIASLSIQYSLGVRKMVLTSEQKQDGPSLDVRLSVVGTKEDISRFVGHAYRSVPLVSFLFIDLSKTPAGPGGEQRYQAVFSMEFHHAAPPSSIGKPSETLPVLTDEAHRLLLSLREYDTFPGIEIEAEGDISQGHADRLFNPEEE